MINSTVIALLRLTIIIVKRVAIFGLVLIAFVAILVVIATLKYPKNIIELIENRIPTPTRQPLQIKGIAVLGDSQSDEYRADDNRGFNYPSTTLNWIELLEKKRDLNFGKWGIWEEPRRTGYEYNWSRTSATANNLLVTGQHIGAAEQVREGKVNLVIIFIGINDFAPFEANDGYQVIYDNTLSDTEILQKVNRIVADIKTAVEAIDQAGDVRILLIKVPDWGNHIGMKLAYPYPDQRERVTRAIELTNRELEKMAKEYDIPTVDPNEFYRGLERQANGSKIQIDDVTLERLLLNNDPKNMYLDDGVHAGTVMSGLFANYVIRHLNDEIETHIKPFSNKEILSIAGIK